MEHSFLRDRRYYAKLHEDYEAYGSTEIADRALARMDEIAAESDHPIYQTWYPWTREYESTGHNAAVNFEIPEDPTAFRFTSSSSGFVLQVHHS